MAALAPESVDIPSPPERFAVLGGGTIATGLAAVVAMRGDVTLLCRSAPSAERAGDAVRAQIARIAKDDPDAAQAANARLHVGTDPAVLAGATFVVEAIKEEVAAKTELFGAVAGYIALDAILATTTSSLSVEELAAASGQPERFVGLHVFNPVPRMTLVELVFPAAASESTRTRARTACEWLDKTAVEVPDTPGFVVNNLLFDYLFDAVRLADETGLRPEAVDTCMQLGAGHPLGPMALLDLVGLDVAQAIGERIGAPIPDTLRRLVDEGALGRKAGRGFYTY